MLAILNAPRRSDFPARKLCQAIPQAEISTRYTTISEGTWLLELLGAGIRSATVHGPMIRNDMGFPRHAAASTRSLTPVCGSSPFHAARVSELASGVHRGSVAWKRDGSKPAA